MKKIISILAALMLIALPAAARDRVYNDGSCLPKAATQTIQKYFGKVGINHVKVDTKTFGGADYDVVLNNGTEIEFNTDGQLTEIDCGRSAIPDGLVLKPIRDYVSKNFKGKKIVGMEVNRSSYDIELIDGTELKFDRSGKFIRIDD